MNTIPRRERPTLLAPLERATLYEASQKGESFALIRPKESKFYWKSKSSQQITKEKISYQKAARQLSFLDSELESYHPLPLEFRMKVVLDDGEHDYSCQDWETSATYWKHTTTYGEKAALSHLSNVYNNIYPEKGFALIFGTIKKRPNQWLLLGVIRVEMNTQGDLLNIAAKTIK